MGSSCSKQEESQAKDKKGKITNVLGQTVENHYDTDFNWNNDIWAGADVQTDYVKMSKPESKDLLKNEAFYYMYKSKNTEKPKVLVHCIGGPGCCVLLKAFGGINPIDIDVENKCLVANENSITSEYHVIYLECPVGAGFSICHQKTKVSDYKTLGSNAVEVFRHIFEKNSYLKSAEFYFEGESFCGLSMPAVIDALVNELHIDFKGALLSCGVTHVDQINSSYWQQNLLQEEKQWDGCHKCCCSSSMGFMACLRRNKCMSAHAYEDTLFLPWLCPGKMWLYRSKVKDKFSNKEEKKYFTKVDIVNVKNKSDKDTICVNEVVAPRQVELQITTKKFAELIDAKNPLKNIYDVSMMNIMEGDSEWSSNDLISKFINNGKKIIILSGEGDYIVPWKGIWNQLEKNWDFEGKEDFVKKPWEKYETGIDGKKYTKWYHKKLDNFEWRRIVDGGHMIYKDQPELYVEILKELLE